MTLDLSFPRRPVVDMFLAGDWRTVTSDVRQGTIKIERGRKDESANVTASKCTFTLDDGVERGDGSYNPRNPMGAYFGSLGRNTPVRVALEVGKDAFTRTVASGGWGTSPQNGAWSVTGVNTYGASVSGGEGVHSITTTSTFALTYLAGVQARDVDVTVDVTVDSVSNVLGGDVEPANIVVRGSSISSYYMLRVTISAAELVQLRIMRGSGIELAGPVSLSELAYTGQKLRVRFQAEGSTLRGKLWPAAGPEPFDWQITTTVPADPAPLAAGWVGVRSGVAGSNTNTKPILFRYDDFEIRLPRFTGETAELAPSRDVSHANRTVKVVATGILRRLSASPAPLQSALRRAIPTTNPVHYWPLEEGALGDIGQPAVGGSPVILTSALDRSKHWGQGKLHEWTSPVLALYGGGDRISATAHMSSAPNTLWRLWFYLTGDEDSLLKITVETTSGAWTLEVDPSALDPISGLPGRVRITPPGVAASDVYSSLLGSGTPLSIWFEIRPDLPSFPDDLLAILFVSTPDGRGSSPTVIVLSKFVTDVSGIRIEGNGDGKTPAGIGHVALYDYDVEGAPNFLLEDAHAGWLGETAGRRIERLCDEEGIPFDYIGDLDITAPMGPQRAGVTLVKMLQECEAADLGASLYEPRGSLGIGYRTASTVYEQLAVELDYAAGEVAPEFVPVFDDQQTRNSVTAKRQDGGEYLYERTSGPLNVNDPGDDPDAVGRYDTSVTVNVETDDQLPDQAAWRVHLGTVDEARYPTITADLRASAVAAQPDLVRQLLELNVNDFLTVVNVETLQVYEPIRQLVRGYTEVFDTAYRHLITYNTTPASPYDSASLDDAHMRLDSDTTTLQAPLDATDTTADVITLDDGTGTAWVTTAANPAEFPFDIAIGGERMTVTACVGSALSQTFTVTRSVNGVVKAHEVGTQVSLAEPAFLVPGEGA